MVWGGIIADKKTELVTVDGRLTGGRYAHAIFLAHVIPICGKGNNNLCMTTPHLAKP